MRRLVALLFLLIALPAQAQMLNFPGFPGQGGSAIFNNFTAGPGNVSITGNTSSSVINNVNINGVLNVKAYGAKADGVTDDSGAINAAEAAALNAGTCVYMPAGHYLVTHDLNFTSLGKSVCLYGDGPAQTYIQCNDTGGNCLDLSGSDGFKVRDLQLDGGTSAANAPKTVILLARIPGYDGFGHTLDRVWTTSFGPYPIYDYGAEVANWSDVRANSPGTTISSCNSAGIVSAFQSSLATAPTSMTVVNVRGGNFNTTGGIANCAVTFDADCGSNNSILDINFWGTFIGEASGGGTAFCDRTGSGTNPNIFNLSLIGVRMEASDSNANYRFIDMSRAPTHVGNLYMANDMMGMAGAQANPVLNFTACVDQSRIELWPPTETGGIILNASCARGDAIYGINKAAMSHQIIWGTGNVGENGNYIQYFDQVSPFYGHVDAGGSDPQNIATQVNGISAGTVVWNMPVHATYAKTVMLSFQGYENTTATSQVVVYPLAFTVAPSQYGGCPAGLVLTDATRATLPASMSAAFTGNCIISGY